MKILLFGCQEVAASVLEFLLSTQHEVVGLVEHENEADRKFNAMLAKDVAIQNEVPTFHFDKWSVALPEADIAFSIYYRKIIPERFIGQFSKGFINLHPSRLPTLRGPVPSMWNILRGDPVAATTLHYLTPEVDAGDIIAQRTTNIGKQTGFELNKTLMRLGVELFKKNFDSIMSGTNTRRPQVHENATYCLPYTDELRRVRWDDQKYILRQVQAFNRPYAGALAQNKHCKVALYGLKKIGKRTSFKPPGSYEVEGGSLMVQTGTTPLKVYDWDLLSGTLKPKGRFE